jgi:hypothetical protein
MPRTGILAPLLALAIWCQAPPALAALVSGTWSVTVTGWASSPIQTAPTLPISLSASFAFDDAATTFVVPIPSGSVTDDANFPVSSAFYRFFAPTPSALQITWARADGGRLIATFSPTTFVSAVFFCNPCSTGPDVSVVGILETVATGGFVPTLTVPEPAAFALLGAGLVGLGAARRLRRHG